MDEGVAMAIMPPGADVVPARYDVTVAYAFFHVKGVWA
jgi:hypothetical protein